MPSDRKKRGKSKTRSNDYELDTNWNEEEDDPWASVSPGGGKNGRPQLKRKTEIRRPEGRRKDSRGSRSGDPEEASRGSISSDLSSGTFGRSKGSFSSRDSSVKSSASRKNLQSPSSDSSLPRYNKRPISRIPRDPNSRSISRLEASDGSMLSSIVSEKGSRNRDLDRTKSKSGRRRGETDRKPDQMLDMNDLNRLTARALEDAKKQTSKRRIGGKDTIGGQALSRAVSEGHLGEGSMASKRHSRGRDSVGRSKSRARGQSSGPGSARRRDDDSVQSSGVYSDLTEDSRLKPDPRKILNGSVYVSDSPKLKMGKDAPPKPGAVSRSKSRSRQSQQNEPVKKEEKRLKSSRSNEDMASRSKSRGRRSKDDDETAESTSKSSLRSKSRGRRRREDDDTVDTTSQSSPRSKSRGRPTKGDSEAVEATSQSSLRSKSRGRYSKDDSNSRDSRSRSKSSVRESRKRESDKTDDRHRSKSRARKLREMDSSVDGDERASKSKSRAKSRDRRERKSPDSKAQSRSKSRARRPGERDEVDSRSHRKNDDTVSSPASKTDKMRSKSRPRRSREKEDMQSSDRGTSRSKSRARKLRDKETVSDEKKGRASRSKSRSRTEENLSTARSSHSAKSRSKSRPRRETNSNGEAPPRKNDPTDSEGSRSEAKPGKKAESTTSSVSRSQKAETSQPTWPSSRDENAEPVPSQGNDPASKTKAEQEETPASIAKSQQETTVESSMPRGQADDSARPASNTTRPGLQRAEASRGIDANIGGAKQTSESDPSLNSSGLADKQESGQENSQPPPPPKRGLESTASFYEPKSVARRASMMAAKETFRSDPKLSSSSSHDDQQTEEQRLLRQSRPGARRASLTSMKAMNRSMRSLDTGEPGPARRRRSSLAMRGNDSAGSLDMQDVAPRRRSNAATGDSENVMQRRRSSAAMRSLNNSGGTLDATGMVNDADNGARPRRRASLIGARGPSLRRLSMTAGMRGQSSNKSLAGDVEPIGDFSHRLSPEEEEARKKFEEELGHVNYKEIDVFSSYCWSFGRQDQNRIQHQRNALRESVRASPLYQAYLRIQNNR